MSTVVASTACPECTEQVTFTDQPRAAELVVCPSCAAELEVLTIDPVLLGLAPEVEEDWGE